MKKSSVAWINLIAGLITLYCAIDTGNVLGYLIGCINLLVFVKLIIVDDFLD